MSAVPSQNWPWPSSWAPQWLNQPINPGWAFGNVIVNHQNSSAPEVERDVVSQHSYGRQINKLMAAVVALADLVPDARDNADVECLVVLSDKIDKIKERSKDARAAELLDELRLLKRTHPDGWNDLVKKVNGA
jgi:hypothetical protein